MDKKIFKGLTKPVFGILVVAAAWWFFKWQSANPDAFSPASIRDYVRGFGNQAAVIYILAYVLNTISIFPPIAVLSVSAGLIFGKVWGAVFLMSAAMLGTSCTFFISRFFGRGLIEKFARGRFKGFDDALEKKGFLAVLFFRAIPVIPYEVINYASGLSKISFKKYFLATFIGIIPGVLVSAFFGEALGEVKRINDVVSSKFLLAFAVLIIAVSVPIIYRWVKKKSQGRYI